MESKMFYLILKNSAKLEKLINTNAPYEKILKQSQKLDKYIIKQIELLRKAGRPAGPRIGKRRTRKDGKP